MASPETVQPPTEHYQYRVLTFARRLPRRLAPLPGLRQHPESGPERNRVVAPQGDAARLSSMPYSDT